MYTCSPLEVRPTIIIAGDSMVRSTKGWLLSRRKSVKVQTFSGATTDEMEVFIRPLINRYPQHPVLHCGTNDLAYKDPEDVAGNIIRMVQEIKKHGCFVSTLITHRDNLNQNEKVKKVNHLLNNSPGENTAIISSYKLACASIRANTEPKARRYARPKGGHYESRGLCIRLYRYANQLVRSLLPD